MLVLRQAERELDAATRLTDVNAAAKRFMRAKAELKALTDVPAKKAEAAVSAAGP